MTTAVVCAYSPVGTEALKGLLEAGVQILALYTYPQSPSESWFVPPAEVANAQGIPVHMPQDFNQDDVYDAIRALEPDYLFSFYFREMIQPRFLALPRLGAFNLHGSLLPRYRGRAPINWVLVRGETQTGITLHTMTPRPDDGDIIAQQTMPIAWDETALSLTLKAADAGRTLVRDAIKALSKHQITPVSQKTLGPSSYFGGRKPQDSRLDFQMTAAEAFNQIRAVADPWPNAFLETPAGQIYVPWALPSQAPCPQGHFRCTPEGVLLGFADGALRIHVLRRSSRSERPSDHAAWLRMGGLLEAR